MSPHPIVSVVLPTHNRVAFIERAVASVLTQSESDLELIIVDDGSTDGTPQLLRRLAASEPRIRLMRNDQPRGGGGARNVGIEASLGKWVAFLDDDDEWLPKKLECQLARLADDPGAVACACDFQQHFPSGKTRLFRVPTNVTLQHLWRNNVLGGASVCVCSRETLVRIGGFDTRLRAAQDYDLWIRLRQQGRIAVCPEPLVKYQEHEGDRISSRFDSQLRGARRLYFKYRRELGEGDRRRHLSFLCYVKSYQSTRRVRFRLRYLMLCLRNSTLRAALSHGAHSAPRLIKDLLA
jgi:glycosyltransferase involved in cell wall biosynthesis